MDHKEHLKHIRHSLMEAGRAYTLLKGIYCYRGTDVSNKKLAEKCVDIQNKHCSFFGAIEISALTTFIICIFHALDDDPRSHSFYKVDKERTKKFIKDNEEIYQTLNKMRNKIFAHKDINQNEINTIINLESTNIFFSNLYKLYNDLSRSLEGASMDFRFELQRLLNNVTTIYIALGRDSALRQEEEFSQLFAYSRENITQKLLPPE